MKRLVPITLLLTCLVGVGCATKISENMESWKGHNISELIAQWGPPSTVVDLGADGKVYSWLSEKVVYNQPGTSTSTSTTTSSGRVTNTRTTHRPAQQHSYTASRSFWVDTKGVIYNWAWRGI